MPPTFFTPSKVSKCIKQLKRNGSAGPDDLPAEFYKVTDSFVRFPLSVVFNVSIQTGELPDIWKVASVTPIFKKAHQVILLTIDLYHFPVLHASY